MWSLYYQLLSIPYYQFLRLASGMHIMGMPFMWSHVSCGSSTGMPFMWSHLITWFLEEVCRLWGPTLSCDSSRRYAVYVVPPYLVVHPRVCRLCGPTISCGSSRRYAVYVVPPYHVVHPWVCRLRGPTISCGSSRRYAVYVVPPYHVVHPWVCRLCGPTISCGSSTGLPFMWSRHIMCVLGMTLNSSVVVLSMTLNSSGASKEWYSVSKL